MSIGLIRRAFRELAGMTLFLGLALAVFQGILAYVMPTFSQRFAAFVLIECFLTHATDQIPFFSKARPPSILVG